MLHDIDVRLYQWGDYVRERQDYGLGYPRRNIIHKAMREGPSAGQSSGKGEPPMPTGVEEIESALTRAPEAHKETAKARYVAQVTDKVAANRLKISVSQYRQRIDQLHHYIAGALSPIATTSCVL